MFYKIQKNFLDKNKDLSKYKVNILKVRRWQLKQC